MRSYFADGCDHEIFEPNINSCFRKVAHMQMAKAVTQKALCVCGYHVYKDIWKVAVGETVVCVLEPDNFYEKNTVVVEKDGRIIGHLPWKVSRFHALFLKIHVGGTTRCTVTGRCLMVGNTASKSR